MIARYTRPQLGAIWTDEARMETWRRVEVAACEEMEGPAAGEIVVRGAHEVTAALIAQARAHVDTVCVGRTHGVHAEPTTFGIKLAGFAFEAHRNAQRLDRAFGQASVGALSGAVGTYATLGPDFEARVLETLGLRR